MALNTKLDTNTGLPVELEGKDEIFLLRRESIEFDATVRDSGRFRGKGIVVLTTLRLVFLSENRVRDSDDTFISFECPLACIKNESFNQPIFGANNLTFQLDRYEIGPSDVALTFRNGGAGTLLRALGRLLSEYRSSIISKTTTRRKTVVRPSDYVREAFVDPSDPSVLFLSQPEREEEGVEMIPIEKVKAKEEDELNECSSSLIGRVNETGIRRRRK